MYQHREVWSKRSKRSRHELEVNEHRASRSAAVLLDLSESYVAIDNTIAINN